MLGESTIKAESPAGFFLETIPNVPPPNDVGVRGFIYQNGQYTILTRGSETDALGISDGKVVGYFRDGFGAHGFLYSDGQWTQLDYPGAEQTFAWGINGEKIVGTWSTRNDRGVAHGFS